MSDLAVPAAVLAFAAFAPALVKPWLRRWGAIDYPEARSSHAVPTVRGGGVALILALIAGVLFAWAITVPPVEVVVVVAIGTISGLAGFHEDARGLSIVARLVAQAAIGVGLGLWVVFALDAPAWWLFVSMAGTVVFVNVANFMDGVDMLSALAMIAVAVTWAVGGWLWGVPWLVIVALVIGALFLTFLPWNVAGTGLFLGDSGSYLIGGLLASTVALAVVDGRVPWPVVLAPLVIYGADTVTTLVERILRRESWSESHRKHHYHRLEDSGLSHRAISGVVAAGGVLASVAATTILLFDENAIVVAAAAVVLVGVLYLVLARLTHRRLGQVSVLDSSTNSIP